MLTNLIEEVRNRRLLALAALGVLVALALPLLFLKGSPDGSPAADVAAPAAAKEAKLPARAARLLATTDAGSRGRAHGSSEDPFAPPASYRAAIAAATAKTAATTSAAKAPTGAAKGAPATSQGTPDKPIPVVIRNADGSKDNASPKRSDDRSSAPAVRRARTVAVDVRFGAHQDSRIRRAIPRNQGFYIHGKLVALFVKYSPTRHAAVFAVAPNLHITGPNRCRVQNNVCRYLDIPAGSHARLTTIIDRTIVSRRLDVVHATRRSSSANTRATAASDSAMGACLLRKLRAMEPGDALLDRDACER